MKKLAVLGMRACTILAFSPCKPSESAYKKAHEKARQQGSTEPQTTTPVGGVAPVVSAPIEVRVVGGAPVGMIREEKVTVVSGVDGLKGYSAIYDSSGVKANVENLKNFLDREGYNAVIVSNAGATMYRVIVSTYANRNSVANAHDASRVKYPNCQDFQGARLLYRTN